MNPLSYAGMIPGTADEVVVHFVYGTLCRGQCRETCWPLLPLGVHPAWIEGTLFGRGDYPALRPGNQRVGGECWFFAKRDADLVTAALDEIEVTNQPGHPNLYDRVELRANLITTSHQNPNSNQKPANEKKSANTQKPAKSAHFPQTWTAFAYHYATDPLLAGFERLTESETAFGQYVVWPTEKWQSASVR